MLFLLELKWNLQASRYSINMLFWRKWRTSCTEWLISSDQMRWRRWRPAARLAGHEAFCRVAGATSGFFLMMHWSYADPPCTNRCCIHQLVFSVWKARISVSAASGCHHDTKPPAFSQNTLGATSSSGPWRSGLCSPLRWLVPSASSTTLLWHQVISWRGGWGPKPERRSWWEGPGP